MKLFLCFYACPKYIIPKRILFKYNRSCHSWLKSPQKLPVALKEEKKKKKTLKRSTFLIKILCLCYTPISSTSAHFSLFGPNFTSIMSFQHHNTNTPSQPSQGWCLGLDCSFPASIRFAFLDHLGLLLQYSYIKWGYFFTIRPPALHSLIRLWLSYMQLLGFNILFSVYFAFYYMSLKSLYDLRLRYIEIIQNNNNKS